MNDHMSLPFLQVRLDIFKKRNAALNFTQRDIL